MIFYPRVVLSVFLWLSPHSGITGSGLGASAEKNLDLLNLVVKERATLQHVAHYTELNQLVNYFVILLSIAISRRVTDVTR